MLIILAVEDLHFKRRMSHLLLTQPGHPSLKGCKLLLGASDEAPQSFSSSLHILLLPLFWGEMKQEAQRIVVSIPLLYSLKRF